MKIKNVNVYGLESSILRSGYPMQVGEPEELTMIVDDWSPDSCEVKDLKRANNLADTPIGSGHNNFLKGIIVQFDLQYPEYFSPQLQRYNWIDIISSQSKMHKITSRELTKDDFTIKVVDETIEMLNSWVKQYNNFKNTELKKQLFNAIIQNLPSGYLKWMGISTNYLQLKNIYKQRKNHKLDEWKYFCKWIKELPMSELITND